MPYHVRVKKHEKEERKKHCFNMVAFILYTSCCTFFYLNIINSCVFLPKKAWSHPKRAHSIWKNKAGIYIIMVGTYGDATGTLKHLFCKDHLLCRFSGYGILLPSSRSQVWWRLQRPHFDGDEMQYVRALEFKLALKKSMWLKLFWSPHYYDISMA